MKARFYIKGLFVAYLLYVSAQIFTVPGYWPFIQYVNLIFHEAGHVLLMFFGEFLHLLGGTIFEISVPFLITLYFLIPKQYFSAGFGAWWLSSALHSVSVYAGDASVRALPLLGGDHVHHDWFTLLSMFDILGYDRYISAFFLMLSLIALGFALAFFYRDFKKYAPQDVE